MRLITLLDTCSPWPVAMPASPPPWPQRVAQLSIVPIPPYFAETRAVVRRPGLTNLSESPD